MTIAKLVVHPLQWGSPLLPLLSLLAYWPLLLPTGRYMDCLLLSSSNTVVCCAFRCCTSSSLWNKMATNIVCYVIVCMCSVCEYYWLGILARHGFMHNREHLYTPLQCFWYAISSITYAIHTISIHIHILLQQHFQVVFSSCSTINNKRHYYIYTLLHTTIYTLLHIHTTTHTLLHIHHSIHIISYIYTPLYT